MDAHELQQGVYATALTVDFFITFAAQRHKHKRCAQPYQDKDEIYDTYTDDFHCFMFTINGQDGPS